MIYVLIAGAVVGLLLVWFVYQRRPSMVRSTEEFRTTLDKISPQGSAAVEHRPDDGHGRPEHRGEETPEHHPEQRDSS